MHLWHGYFPCRRRTTKRAIGARMGWGFEASYQHTMKGADFLEADLGLFTLRAQRSRGIQFHDCTAGMDRQRRMGILCRSGRGCRNQVLNRDRRIQPQRSRPGRSGIYFLVPAAAVIRPEGTARLCFRRTGLLLRDRPGSPVYATDSDSIYLKSDESIYTLLAAVFISCCLSSPFKRTATGCRTRSTFWKWSAS